MEEFLFRFRCERTKEGYLPFKDDKPEDTENSPFVASSVLVVKASLNDQH